MHLIWRTGTAPLFIMELQVDISKLELQGAQNVNVTCTADNGSDVRESTSRTATANSQPRRKFSFTFARSVPQAILSFSARDAASGAEVGKCAVLVTLQARTSPVDDLLSGADSRSGRTAILTSSVAGTDIVKFVGKIHFSTQHTYSVPPSSEMSLPWPTARYQRKDPSAYTIDDLVAREAATLGNTVAVPDGDATVTIIFHALNLEGAVDIKPIACPGSEGGVKEARRVLQHKVSRMQSILVQKKLRCTDAEAINIYILNQKTGHMIFCMSLPLTSLQPFVYKHWCQPFTGSRPASFSTLVDGHSPGMISTAVVTASKTNYSQYDGLELCICSVEPGFSTDYSKIVVCAQIINKNSKSGLREPNFHEPPFDQGNQTKKKVLEGNNRQDVLVYKMAIMNIAPRCEEVYFFFPADQEVNARGNFALRLTLYPVRPTTNTPWWEAPQVGSTYLEITSIMSFLQQAECQNGVQWEGAIEEPLASPRSEEQNSTSHTDTEPGSISAVLRWKTRQLPFISLPTVFEFRTLPDLNHHMSVGSPDVGMPERVPVEVTSHDLHATSNEADLSLLLAQHKKAISQMGQDILQLRQQNASLMAENKQLQLQVHSIQGDSIDYAKLEAMEKHELVQTVLLLQNELSAETASRKESQNRAQVLKNALERQGDCEAQYAELLEVHAIQQRLVQQLQSKVQKYQRCYEICKQQQTIVNQLEALLAHQITTQDMSLTQVTTRLQRDNAEIRTTLHSYQDDDDTQQRLAGLQQREQSRVEAELSRAVARCRQLEALLEAKTPQGHDRELQQRLLLAETQVSALLTELKESARKWAIEKSHYEMKLANQFYTGSDAEPTCTSINPGGKIISF